MNAEPTPPPFDRLGDALALQAQTRPGATALVWDEGAIAYGELRETVERCAGALLGAGVGHGDRVAVLSTPRWEQVVLFLACCRVGAIFVGLNPRHTDEEIEYVLRDSRPGLAFGQPEFEGAELGERLARLVEREGLAERLVPIDAPGGAFSSFLESGGSCPTERLSDAAAAVAPEDGVAIVYTSGSTGTRKGVLLSSRGLIAAFWPGNADLGLSAPIHCLNDLPIDHLGGMVERLLPPLFTGGKTVLHPRFDPRAFLRDAAQHGVTYLQGEVTQWLRCLALPEFQTVELPDVEVVLYTGAAAPPHLLDALNAKFPRVVTAYGMSETSGPVTFTGPLGAETPPGTVGAPLRGVELRIDPEDGSAAAPGASGSIRVRGDVLTPGYFGRPEASRALLDDDGWLVTGDRGTIEADGQLRLVGRDSDMYKSGGYNIWPREIEQVVERHPGVTLAAVVSVPDPEFQEVGVAFVTGAVGEDELLSHCRQHLANYKVPKRVRVLGELPLLENGKVDKRSLRARHLEETGEGAG